MGIILVIDDSDLIRRALVRKLQFLGHTPYQAENGLAAKAILATVQVDAIISDVSMPVMDGITFYYWLKATFPSLATRFAFLSSEEELVSGDPNLKGVPFYEKPFVGDMKPVFAKLLNGDT